MPQPERPGRPPHQTLRTGVSPSANGTSPYSRNPEMQKPGNAPLVFHPPTRKLPLFSNVWSEHPTIKGDAPLLDHKVYENQCAVNLYAALQRTKVDVSTFKGAMSWQKDAPKYAIRAQEVSDWLDTGACGFGRSTVPPAVGPFEVISGKTGVVFFQNYYGPGMSGDHIDLFNGTRMTALSTWPRIHLGIHWEGLWSDYRNSRTIRFWALA
jgi:Type VI secretion system (T6SS), amidase effector protein 4